MKLTIITLLLSLIGATVAQTTMGTFMGRAAAEDVSCSTSTFGVVCDSCSTAKVCNGEYQLGTVTCASPNSFCDSKSNTCSATRPEDCTSGFKCSSEGFFPDPTNCDVYYFCTSTMAADQYQCPTGYVYDSLNFNCKKKAVTADCVTMKCTKAGDFVVNTRNPTYYAFCDATLQAQLFACPTGESFVKDSFGCKFVCKAEGYFAGPTPSEYYLCTKSGTVYTANHNTCPTGYIFNVTLKYCTKSA